MKSILYVGATLMIGATIYGFVDYKRTSQRREFINLYKEKESPAPFVVVTHSNEVPVKKEMVVAENLVSEKNAPAIKRVSVTGKKYKPVRRRKISYKLFSRAALVEKIDKK